MRITMIGTGYVGLVSGACFSDFGHDVICVDKDERKIAALKDGIMPIYEPGLTELVGSNARAGRLSFTTDLAPAVADADAVFIAVGTPSRRGDGHADLSYVYAATREIAAAIRDAFFPNGGTSPQLRFMLSPLSLGPGSARATVTLGTAAISDTGHQAPPTAFNWPGSDGMSFVFDGASTLTSASVDQALLGSSEGAGAVPWIYDPTSDAVFASAGYSVVVYTTGNPLCASKAEERLSPVRTRAATSSSWARRFGFL